METAKTTTDNVHVQIQFNQAREGPASDAQVQLGFGVVHQVPQTQLISEKANLGRQILVVAHTLLVLGPLLQDD